MFINKCISRTKFTSRLLTLPVAILFLCAAHVSNADDIFIKIGDIKGEAVDRDYQEQIQALAWNWGMAQSAGIESGGTRTRSAVSIQELTFTHYLDSATPALMQACATGKFFPRAFLSLRRPGASGQAYLVIELGDVVVANVATGGGAAGDRPVEEVSLNFSKVRMAYRGIDSSGKATASIPFEWDVARNIPRFE